MKLPELLSIKDQHKMEIERLKSLLADAQNNMDSVNADIEAAISDSVTQARQLSGKDTGTVDVLVQGVMVKHCIPKKVSWDQSKMESIRQRILDHQDNPDNYMDAKTTYKVTEKAFKAFPGPVKVIFAEAREVKAGKPKITFDTERS